MGTPYAYRSEDYTPLTSGSAQTITFSKETNFLLLHNRSAYEDDINILFYPDGISNVPITLTPGESISIPNGQSNSIVIIPTKDNPIWQIILTVDNTVGIYWRY
jgi:hypothetical protein